MILLNGNLFDLQKFVILSFILFLTSFTKIYKNVQGTWDHSFTVIFHDSYPKLTI